MPRIDKNWLALLLALLAGLSLHTAALAGDTGGVPHPDVLIATPGHCIEPAAQMLRDHPALLRHQRDLTVHQGVRGATVSIRTCIGCHANPVTHSVLGTPNGFCQGCHVYVGAKPDCFECHSPLATGRDVMQAAAISRQLH